jgi:hypothetical protein
MHGRNINKENNNVIFFALGSMPSSIFGPIPVCCGGAKTKREQPSDNYNCLSVSLFPNHSKPIFPSHHHISRSRWV